MLASSFPRTKDDYKAKWILELCTNISKNNHNLIVLAPHTNNLKSFETYEDIKVYRFKYAPQNLEVLGYGNFLPHEISHSKLEAIYLYIRNILLLVPFIFSMFFSSVVLCKKEKIDILLSHWIFPCGFIGLITAKILGITPILQIYGTDLVFIKSFQLSWLGKIIMNFYPVIIAISQYTKNIAMSFGIKDPNKVKVIPVGVEAPKLICNAGIENIRFKYNIKNEKIIFSMHRLIPLKGTKYLIKAASHVIDKYPNVKFIDLSMLLKI
jgi:glycosyltransferase involved in cell wall biosynthesis